MPPFKADAKPLGSLAKITALGDSNARDPQKPVPLGQDANLMDEGLLSHIKMNKKQQPLQNGNTVPMQRSNIFC